MQYGNSLACSLARIAAAIARNPTDVTLAKRTARMLFDFDSKALKHPGVSYCHELLMDELLQSKALKLSETIQLERVRSENRATAPLLPLRSGRR